MTKIYDKNSVALYNEIRKQISAVENKYDDMSMQDFQDKSIQEQSYIEGWIAACQALRNNLPKVNFVKCN